jgi:hypothetical protein
VPRRRGQFALLGIIIFATLIILAVHRRDPEPAYMIQRGQMQSAQLVNLARACMAVGCSNATLVTLVQDLLNRNASSQLYMFPITNAYYTYRTSTYRYENYTFFTIQTLRGPETVAVAVSAQSGSTLNTFSKSYHGVTYILKNTTLTYCHVYASPFFPIQPDSPSCPISLDLTGIVYCPRIYDPNGIAEVKLLDPRTCTWAVAVPGNYTLRDEFYVPVKVVVKA